jgi:hypothetical protein
VEDYFFSSHPFEYISCRAVDRLDP